MEGSGSKHTFSIHTPFRARGTQAGPRTLGKADGPTPAAEAGDAALTGGAGLGHHHCDAAPNGHGARGNLAARGGAIHEVPQVTPPRELLTPVGREGTGRAEWPVVMSPTPGQALRASAPQELPPPQRGLVVHNSDPVLLSISAS